MPTHIALRVRVAVLLGLTACTGTDVEEAAPTEQALQSPAASVTAHWELNGATVQKSTTAEGYHYPIDEDTSYVTLPKDGRSIGIAVRRAASHGPISVSGCNQLAALPSEYALTLNTVASPVALPAEWRGHVFGFRGPACGLAVDDPASVVTFTWTLTTVTRERLAGSYEVVLAGKGSRAGSTLRVSGSFDQALTKL
jgi:hypothetical protein